MTKKISTTQERLSEMMKIYNISAADIVRKTGINKSTLSNYINGKRVAVQNQLALISDAYGIDPAWLMGYDVPMKLVSNDELDPDLMRRAMEYYEKYDSLPPEKKTALDNYLSYLQSST